MKLGAHGLNRLTSGPRAQIMRKSIFTAKSQFSWNWVLTAQIDAQVVPELRTSEYQFLSPNCNFHEIGCSRPKSTHKRSPSSDHEKINFYGRNAIFMKLGAHARNRCTSGPRAQIMRKSIFTAESQFSSNWVLTAQIDSQALPSWDQEKIKFYGRIAIFMKLGDHGPNRLTKRSPSSDHEKINFYGRIAIFMKLGAHGPNRRTSGPRAQIMRKSIFTAESQFSWNWVLAAQIDAQAVPELRLWENQFLPPNRNFHEIGCSRPKSTNKRSPSSDYEKINFYRRIAIFMKLGAHGLNRLTSGPRAQIMRKSIFTAESQFSWNWVLTAQIDAQVVPELRTSEYQFLSPNCNFHEIGCSRPKSTNKRSPSSDHEKINFYGRIAIFMKLRYSRLKSTHKSVPELRTSEYQFLSPTCNFHDIGCSRPKSTHNRSPSSDHDKINFYGRIAIFMKLGAHGLNRLTSGPRAQIMRKSIFTAESQFSGNCVLTAQIYAKAVPELRSWENEFSRPNRNFHEIGCSRPKSTHKRSPISDHEKINFYGQIAIFIKLGAHGPNRLTSAPRAEIMRKSSFTAESQFSWNWVITAQIDSQSGPRAQIMRKSIFTAESQISWNWVLTAQIDSQALPELRSWENQVLRPNRNSHEIWLSRPKSTHKAVPELRSWENQFLRPNRNFHEIGCSRPKSTHKRSPSSDHEKINFYGRIAIFMKLGAHGPNRLTSGPRAQIMRKSIFTAKSQFSWNWVLTAQIDS